MTITAFVMVFFYFVWCDCEEKLWQTLKVCQSVWCGVWCDCEEKLWQSLKLCQSEFKDTTKLVLEVVF